MTNRPKKHQRPVYDVRVPPRELSPEGQAQWKELEPMLRASMARRFSEMRRAPAVWKDKSCGRVKGDMAGFFGLACAEDALYNLEYHGGTGPELDAARRKVAALKANLSGDDAFLRQVEECEEQFGPYVRSLGMTLVEYLEDRMNLEQELRRDFINGIFMVCERINIDPLAMLQESMRPQTLGERALMASISTFLDEPERTTTRSSPGRRLAEAILKQGLDSSTPVWGTGQGLSRMGQALIGGLLSGMEDKRDRDLEQESVASILAHPALANTAPVDPAVASVAAVPAPLARVPSTAGKIYSNNEPSPLDPPSGADRDMAVRTIVAEAGNQPMLGQVGTASVIRNRAVGGGFGGDTVPGVIQAPNQFEPWNTEAGRTRMAGIDPASPQYQNASRALDSAYFGNDPTGGATNFIAPKAQAALGRPMPKWAQGPGQDIADQRFFGGVNDPNALPAASMPAEGFAVPGQSAAPTAPQQAGPPPAVAAYIKRLIINPDTRKAGVALLANYSKPTETFRQETDESGNVWSVNNTTGQRAVALKRDKPAEEPTSVREYNYYKTNLPEGQAAMPYETWSTARARAAATNVTTNVGDGGSSKQVFDEMVERSKAARATAQGLTAIRTSREAIDNGAITGFRADDRLQLQKAAKYFGIPTADAAKIEGSETFKSAIAPQVASVLRATVGNANISDSDRKFAERAAGGSLDLDEKSIRRLLDIMERASTSQLEDHQATLDSVYPDAEKHKRERALFGVRVVPGGKPMGATQSGLKWSLE